MAAARRGARASRRRCGRRSRARCRSCRSLRLVPRGRALLAALSRLPRRVAWLNARLRSLRLTRRPDRHFRAANGTRLWCARGNRGFSLLHDDLRCEIQRLPKISARRAIPVPGARLAHRAPPRPGRSSRRAARRASPRRSPRARGGERSPARHTPRPAMTTRSAGAAAAPQQLLPRFESSSLGEEYGERATFRLRVPVANVEAMRAALLDATSGRAEVALGEPNALQEPG